MKINPEIFRAYDIRGRYPEELNESLAYQIGRCFLIFLRKKQKKKKLRIAVGQDIRFSSPILFKGVSGGIREGGGDVIDLGLVTTPMLYFAVSYFRYDGGVIITASHNPNPYNGFKLVREKAVPLSGPTGIFWMRDYLTKNKFLKEKRNLSRGVIIKKNIEKEYADSTLKLAGVKRGEFHGFSVALDAGNGAGGPIALKILKMMGAKVYPLYCQPDGSFPHHVPDPLLKENLRDIIVLTKKKKPVFGVAIDGDADRIIFIDENGEPIPGDLITALMAEIILKEKPGRKILYDVRSSKTAQEAIKKSGGVPICYRVGHAFIKEKMRRNNIFFGGEFSGHYYLGQNLFYEVPFFVILKILKTIKEKRATLSRLVAPFRKYYHSGEINFGVKNKKKVLKTLENKFKRGKVFRIDGLRIDFSDWWFLVRPSHTEPVLRLVVEAKTKELMEEKKKELTNLIRK